MISSTLAFFTPLSGGSPNANDIDSLYKITLVIALIIFFAVEGALGYTLIKFRKRKHAVAQQIHGNTQLEVGWTAAAALVLVQAFWVGVAGVALALPAIFALAKAANELKVVVLLPVWLLVATVVVTMVMALGSGIAGLRSLRRIEPAVLLR